MIIDQTSLTGLRVIKPERVEDSRGFFARVGCTEEFEAAGIRTTTMQSSLSQNTQKGTLRGVHFQNSPWEEAKLVRCERGAIFDVAVDLRPDSATAGQWFGIELTQDNLCTLYIPAGFGHAFQTLCDDTRILYHISEKYVPDSGSGVRYDDADLAIDWPLDVSVISEKDLQWPSYEKLVSMRTKRTGIQANE